MKTWFGWLTVSCVLVLIGSYTWTHRQHVAVAVAAPTTEPAETQGTYAEMREADQMVTVTGPMADYMSRQKPSKVETLPAVSYTPSAIEHVGDSPVGTSRDLLHKTFAIASAVDLPFEIPAHASNPQLRGIYRSYVKQGGAQSGEDAADVEFLLLNQQQYTEFLNGRPGEAIFAAEDAHDQEVNTNLPPTLDQPVRYYLVFRNNSHDAGKKVVQADFRIDF
jgi:hypothetical protein